MLKPRRESQRSTLLFKIQAFFLVLVIGVPTLIVGYAATQATDNLALIALVTFGTFVAVANLLGE